MGSNNEVDRYLTLLRNKIREQGFTQLEVQEALGWGRSYISQILTKQKELRVKQVLLILGVIGIDPRDFFSELYGTAPPPPQTHARADVQDLRGKIERLVDALVDRGVIERPE